MGFGADRDEQESIVASVLYNKSTDLECSK